MSIVALRLSLGWLFFWAGITKILNPAWTSQKYLEGAKAFAGFYHFLASSSLLPYTNFINEWGLALIGVSLMLGVFVRLSGILGAVLMLLYYLPILDFPYPNAHSFLVDEHIVYAAALLLLAAFRAGRTFGLESWCETLTTRK